MNCKQAREWFVATLDGEISAEQQAEVQQHVAGCEACQQELASLRAAQQRLRAAMQDDMARLSAPAGSWERLQAALRQDAADRPPAAEPLQVVEPFAEWPDMLLTSNTRQGEQHTMKQSRAGSLAKDGILSRTMSLAVVGIMLAIFVGAVLVLPNRGPGMTPAAAPEQQETQQAAEAVAEPSAELAAEPTEDVPVFHPAEPLLYPAGTTEVAEQMNGERHEWVFSGEDGASLTLARMPAPADDSLPEGEPVMVGELPAVWVAPANDQPEARLVWQMYGGRYEITTTLDREAALTFAESVAVIFTPYQLAEQPENFQRMHSTTFVESGMLVSRTVYWGQTTFLHIEQRPAGLLVPADMEESRAVTVNGHAAQIVEEPGGVMPFTDEALSVEPDSPVLGGGGGGGGGGDQAPPPDEIAYDSALRLVWVRNGVMVEFVSNLSEEEMIALAETLEETAAPEMAGSSPVGDAAAGAPQLAPGVYRQSQPSVNVFAEGFPEGFYAARFDTHYDAASGSAYTETLWYGDEDFVLLVTYPTEQLALSSGEQVEIGDTLGVVRRIPGGSIDVETDSPRLYDGELETLGGGGGGWEPADGSTPAEPETISYDEGSALVWEVDGELLTLVSSLTPGELVAFAEQVTFHPNYQVVSPQGSVVTLMVEGFTPVWPSYLPDALDVVGVDSTPEGGQIIHYASADGETFLLLMQRSAEGVEPAGEARTLADGRAVRVQGGLAGTLDVPGGPEDMHIEYDDAVRVSVIIGDAYAEVLTNLGEAEALQVAEGLLPVE